MNQVEYQTILRDSPSFNQLDWQEQNLIIQADQEQRDYYLQIFRDEKKLLSDSENLFDSQVTQIQNRYHFEHQKEVKESLNSKEECATKQDQESAENLLKLLD